MKSVCVFSWDKAVHLYSRLSADWCLMEPDGGGFPIITVTVGVKGQTVSFNAKLISAILDERLENHRPLRAPCLILLQHLTRCRRLFCASLYVRINTHMKKKRPPTYSQLIQHILLNFIVFIHLKQKTQNGSLFNYWNRQIY